MHENVLRDTRIPYHVQGKDANKPRAAVSRFGGEDTAVEARIVATCLNRKGRPQFPQELLQTLETHLQQGARDGGGQD